ncbi:MAG: amidohydrolase [Gammaproteobacteria bacterium]
MAESGHRAADAVLLDGDFVTFDDVLPRASALAVRDGRIVALGASGTMRDYIGPATRVHELGGAMVLPGLTDGHCHPTKGAIADLFTCRFVQDAAPDGIAAALARSLADGGDADVVIGGRWVSDFFERHALGSPRRWLDALAPTRAVYLRDDSGHNGWANSAALRLVGVDRHSADPPGGRILREADGVEPNGLLLEAADVAARARLPDWSAAQYRAGLLAMQRMAHGFGITALNDADASAPLLAAYSAADRAGELELHVAASISTPYGPRATALDYAHIDALRDTHATPRVDTRFVKIYLDGVPTSARSAAMLAPYVGHPDFPPGHRGEVHVGVETLAADIAELEHRGYTVKLHTAGDGAVRVALDAIERAHRVSGRDDIRHELAHAGFVDPLDLQRFVALNVAADLSPYLWYPAPIMASVRQALGARAEHYWPVRQMVEAGVPLLAGSDWPAAAASMNPWLGIATLVTRRAKGGAETLWGEEAIPLMTALEIFTLGGARALRREHLTGSLSIGKSADLIVLDRDVFAVAPDEVADTKVRMTMFAGEVVYSAEA